LRVGIERSRLSLVRPVHTGWGILRERDLLMLSLSDAEGRTGHGEAAPLEPYDGVPLARVEEALERHRAVLERGDPGRGNLLDACRAADPLPQALAAVDLALWDLAGQRAGRPVAQLLVEDPVAAVPVNATIDAIDRAGAAGAAAQAAADGFQTLKVKVGVGDDAGRVAAVRALAGPAMALRLDANGAWSVEEAVRAIESLAPAGLELVEEPVHGVAATRALRERVDTRIAIDETAAEPGALAAGVADAVCLKISRCGGIAGLLAAATLVRAGGGEVYLASTFDGPLGIAAAVHAAAALAARGPLPACGLATLGIFAEVACEPLVPRRGAIAVPSGPGLGVDPGQITGRA
jgi:L-alanine-DL-glutamate epimerase-like enolase superfamily enzyme